MKNISVIFSALVAGSIILFSCKNNTPSNSAPAAGATGNAAPASATSRIAYVNIDTLEANYNYLKQKKEEFKQRQDAMESELQRSAKQIDDDARNVQSKVEAGTLTKSDYEAAQKRLTQMQQSLITRKQALTDQLMKEQDDFNKDLKTRLDNFLADYNKDKHYDYILSYGSTGNILYANKDLDITWDVIKGMNAGNDNMTKNK